MYQAAVISVFAVGYPRLGKNLLKMTPPSFQKFDLEDTGKLVAIVTASEIMHARVPHQTENHTGTHQRLSYSTKNG